MSESSKKGWFFSAPVDLAFFSCCFWPLLVLLPLLATAGTPEAENRLEEFWLVHFVATPHRWLTLWLIVADPSRRNNRNGLFVLIALVTLAVIGGVWLSTGELLCLLLVDYLWNAWHFASQHSGILTIYGRRQNTSGLIWLEKYLLRITLVWIILQTAAWVGGIFQNYSALRLVQTIGNCAAVAVLALLFLQSIRAGGAKCFYATSVCFLYVGLILSLQFHWPMLTIGFAAASSAMHSTEYIAFVSYYRLKQTGNDSAARLRWLRFLSLWLFGLGTLFAWASQNPDVQKAILAVNLAASFMHYAYDGLIWKLRQPGTSHALGIRKNT